MGLWPRWYGRRCRNWGWNRWWWWLLSPDAWGSVVWGGGPTRYGRGRVLMQSLLRERRTVNVAPLRPWRQDWRVHWAGRAGHLCLRDGSLAAGWWQRHIRHIYSLGGKLRLGDELALAGRLLQSGSIAHGQIESTRLSQLPMVLKRRGLPGANGWLGQSHWAKLIQTRLWSYPRHYLVWHTATDHSWIRERTIGSHSWLWLSHVRPWIHRNWYHARSIWQHVLFL